MYLRQKQGLNMVKAVLDTLTETAYSTRITTTKVMIQSTDSSVLVEFRNQSKYETVYKVEKTISDISDSAIEEIKEFASAVVITKVSVFPTFYGFVTGQTNVVERLQKSQLPVYVELFQNEFVSQPFDFFSEATIEINSYVTGPGINGIMTEFPFKAERYRKVSVHQRSCSIKLLNINAYLCLYLLQGIDVWPAKKLYLTWPLSNPVAS